LHIYDEQRVFAPYNGSHIAAPPLTFIILMLVLKYNTEKNRCEKKFRDYYLQHNSTHFAAPNILKTLTNSTIYVTIMVLDIFYIMELVK